MVTTKEEPLQDVWDAFLKEWPVERLSHMPLSEYSAAGDGHTFTAWIEQRLDKMGSIWGGSSFKFGIYSRKDKTSKPGGHGKSYTQDYAWYSKYGASQEAAFSAVRALVSGVAQAAARGDFAAIDAVDLGEAYKWKIAFHYQDRTNPGVVALFEPKRLRAWLRGRVGTIPEATSEVYREIFSLRKGIELLPLSTQVWEEAAALVQAEQTPIEEGEDEGADADLSADYPLNLILYGPPGTGKTYETAKIAVRICDGVVPDGRQALMSRYRELKKLHRLRFVTFHPSFSYEEFVEGIRPSTENGQVRYDVRPGTFKQVATQARELWEKRGVAPAASVHLQGKRLFKMSLGDSTDSEEAWVYQECIEDSFVCLGFARGIDFAGSDTLEAVRKRYKAQTPGGKETDYAPTAIYYLKTEIKNGDLILISDGNTHFRAIGEVTGPYYFKAREEGYEHFRPVRWLWSTAGDSLPADVLFSKRFSQMTTYLMDQEAVNWAAVKELISPKRAAGQPPNCVLVIDEINRANLAKTFGELITLLEPSKRLGQPDEQETELPYSGDRFGVPPNLHVIGTMNTADRSIALLDVALRRRFSFREMMPRPDLLARDVDGIDLKVLLEAINLRIETLFDRDHILGHTYLMEVTSFDGLVLRFTDQIIPLLQEYFFEDWRRIQTVFRDVGQPIERQIIQDFDPTEEGAAADGARKRFRVNPVISPAAIQKVYS